MCLHYNYTSNSPLFARGKAECDIDCYEYNYSFIAHKCMLLPTHHIALPMTLSPYPCRITISSN